MEDREVIYVGFYDKVKQDNREVFLSCINKMDYIIDSLHTIGEKVTVLSPAWAKQDGRRLCAVDENDDRMHLILPVSRPYRNRIQRKLSALKSLNWLFWQLIRRTDSESNVIVYHSTMLSVPVRAAKAIRHFHMILEIEEAYQDVRQLPKRLVNYENSLIRSADRYIVTTEGLIQRFKILKPCIVLYGAYRNNLHHHKNVSGERIHMLYSGIIDTENRGALNAVECMNYLDPAKFDLHIAGYGNALKLLDERIDEMTKKGFVIVFDGQKRGEEYDRYLETFDIGLNTPSLTASYSYSAFPSKVIFYLCAGLDVVSCRMKSLEESRFESCIHFYDQDNPQEIAKAVKGCGEGENLQIPALINTLETDFHRNLASILTWEDSR